MDVSVRAGAHAGTEASLPLARADHSEFARVRDIDLSIVRHTMSRPPPRTTT